MSLRDRNRPDFIGHPSHSPIPLSALADGWCLFVGFLKTLVNAMRSGAPKMRGLSPRRINSSTKLLAGSLTTGAFLALLILTWTLIGQDHSTPTSVEDEVFRNQKESTPLQVAKVQSFVERSVGRTPLEERGEKAKDVISAAKKQDSAIRIKLPAVPILRSSSKHGKDPCPLRRGDNQAKPSWLESFGRELPPLELHEELAERLEVHSALQHKMCRRQQGFQAVRALVFSCPQKGCMNLETGVRGILLAYLLAVMTNRAFFIRTESWMNFHSHLQVSASWKSIDWRISGCSWAQMTGENRLRTMLQKSRPLNYMKVRDMRCDRIMQFFRMRPNILGIVTDQDTACLRKILMKGGFDLTHGSYESPYTLAYPRLFSFSDSVLNGEFQLQQEHGWDPSNSICIHVRTGAFPSDKRGTGHRNVEDFWQCARMLEHAVGLDKHSEVTWLVVSDDDRIPRQAEAFLTRECCSSCRHAVLSSGHVGHSPPQHHTDASAEGMERLFLDVRLLSRCRYSVLSKSSFGAMAASINPGSSDSKHHILVTEQDSGHGKPLSDVCKRVIPNWDSFQFA